MEKDVKDDIESTIVSWAAIIRIDIEDLKELKKHMAKFFEEKGGKLVFQKMDTSPLRIISDEEYEKNRTWR